MRSLTRACFVVLLTGALLAASCSARADSERAADSESAADTDVVVALDGSEIDLVGPSDKPRLVWFWGPY